MGWRHVDVKHHNYPHEVYEVSIEQHTQGTMDGGHSVPSPYTVPCCRGVYDASCTAPYSHMATVYGYGY